MTGRHDIPIKIIYEDNHLLVVEKPVNIPSQEDESGDSDLLTLLKDDIKIRYNKPGNVYLGLVHRLDRPVGGAMVFAKTSKAASRLSDQIRTGGFGKLYLAVVHGVPAREKATLTHYLLKDSRTNTVTAVPKGTVGSKEAILDYEVLGEYGSMCLVKINLHTGRSHQIRVQFSSTGNPLYGDQRYGMQYSRPGQQIALWSSEIVCEHPTSKETMTFRSLPPPKEPWKFFESVLNL